MEHRIEVYKDMGTYVLRKTVEQRNGQVFLRMKKITRTEYLSL